jgi:antagonist of KipI
MRVLVKRAGFLATVQDLGRRGYRSSGVSLGGALDPQALRVANLLVENEEAAAGLEVTLGTVRLQFGDERWVAWCGGRFDVRIGADVILAGRVARVSSGEELRLIAPPEGARGWLAISGGIDVPLVLGSRATDLRGGFGGLAGRALRDGDVLMLGSAGASKLKFRSRTTDWFAPDEWANTRGAHQFLRVIRGAEWPEFERGALLGASFTVTPESDRMGVRLEGPPLSRRNAADLLSEAVAPGTIQVPPNGQPILLLGDCQTIGGYPKIAHVIALDLPAAAQLRPGDRVRFAEISLGEAQRLLRERERDLELFRVGVRLRRAWS